MEENRRALEAIFGTDFPPSTCKTCCGKYRSWQSLQCDEIAFLVTSLVAIVEVIVFASISISHTPKDDPDFTFDVLIVVNAVMCLYYVVNGILQERPYELAVFILGMITICVYLAVNSFISVGSVISYVELSFTTALCIAVVILGCLICVRYQRSKNLIFRTVGANSDLQNMCATIFIFIDVIKVDFQNSVSMAILVMNNGRDLTLEDKILLPVMCFVSVGAITAGYRFVRYESRLAAIFYAFLWICLISYTSYLIITAIIDLLDTSHDSKMEISLYVVLFVTSAFSYALGITSLCFGIKVYKNLEKGLRVQVFGDKVDDELVPVINGHPDIENEGRPTN